MWWLKILRSGNTYAFLSFFPVTLFTDLLVGAWKSFTFTSMLAELKSPMSASRRRGRCPRMGTQKKLRRKWARLKASCVRTGLRSAGRLWSRRSLAQRPSSRSSSTSASCSRRSRLPEVGRAVVIAFVFWWEGGGKGQQSGVAALGKNQTYCNGFHLPDSSGWWCCSQVCLYHHVLNYDASCSMPRLHSFDKWPLWHEREAAGGTKLLL